MPGLKLAGALALAALFGISAAVRSRDVNPPLYRLLAAPERWDGEALWLGGTVTARGADHLQIESDGLRLLVRGAMDVAPGDRVNLRGIYRAREGRLDLLRGRKVGRGPRWLVEAVSLAALAWVVVNFFRHFRGPR